MRPLSHSSIQLYLDCPQKYKFRYVDGLPEPARHFFAFGGSMHAALEYFHGVKMPPPPTLEELLAFYGTHWEKEGYQSKEQEDTYFKEGDRILREYHRTYSVGFRAPLFVEYQFHLKVDGIPVGGFIDRIDKLENGRLAIVDYKTGHAFDLTRVKNDPQLTMYQMACQERLGLDVESLTLFHLSSLTPFSTGPHSQDQISALRRTIVEVADSIAKEKFDPVFGDHCTWCDFRQFCVYFRYQYATESERGTKTLTAQDVEKIVDRYGELKDKIKQLEFESEDLRKKISEYCKEKKYIRVEGQRYGISASYHSAWKFEDDDRVREILEPVGLWDKVCSFNWRLADKILKDGSMPPDVQKEMEKTGTLVESDVIRLKRLKDREPD